MPIYYVNNERTRAFMIEGHDALRVDFKRIRLGQFVQTDCRLQRTTIQGEDLMKIRRDYQEVTKNIFQEVLMNVVAFSSILFGNGEIDNFDKGQISVAANHEHNMLNVNIHFIQQ